jgi:hypothetical protein
MPRDPKRNLQRYQLQGGHLNEFEFQKSQSEMAEESELPFTDETGKPTPTPAKRIAEVTARAHQKVEKRKKLGLAKAGGRRTNAARKKPAKKVARKSATKTTKRAPAKKRATVKTKGKKKRAVTR